MSKDNRSRSWATLVYPESCPDDWLVQLGMLHINAFVSPLHDKDLLPNGDPKKPHYHVLMLFEGNKSDKQISEYTALFGGVGHEKIGSVRGYARYLCHLDDSLKHRYSPNDVVSFGELDYIEYIASDKDKYLLMAQIEEFCELYDVFSYSQLRRICRYHNLEWYRYICNNAFSVANYLKSLAYEKECPDKFIVKDGWLDYFKKDKEILYD